MAAVASSVRAADHGRWQSREIEEVWSEIGKLREVFRNDISLLTDSQRRSCGATEALESEIRTLRAEIAEASISIKDLERYKADKMPNLEETRIIPELGRTVEKLQVDLLNLQRSHEHTRDTVAKGQQLTLTKFAECANGLHALTETSRSDRQAFMGLRGEWHGCKNSMRASLHEASNNCLQLRTHVQIVASSAEAQMHHIRERVSGIERLLNLQQETHTVNVKGASLARDGGLQGAGKVVAAQVVMSTADVEVFTGVGSSSLMDAMLPVPDRSLSSSRGESLEEAAPGGEEDDALSGVKAKPLKAVAAVTRPAGNPVHTQAPAPWPVGETPAEYAEWLNISTASRGRSD